MSKHDDMKSEIEKLIADGMCFCEAFSAYPKTTDKWADFMGTYEIWYSKANAVVKQILPDRYDDFKLFYKDEKRKGISRANYTISDALRMVTTEGDMTINLNTSTEYGPKCASSNMLNQVQILRACQENLESKLYNITTLLQAELFDNEIETAQHLLNNGHLRAAGAVCGVVMETHFGKIAIKHNLTMTKKNPTIADFNDKFKDVIYDVIQWRFIQRLGDIRNLCVHSKDREPTKDEVQELINGTDKIIKTVF